MSAAQIEISEATPLDTLRTYVSSQLSEVDDVIYNLIKSKVKLIPEISVHTIASGGKRLRPMLTLASANMCGYKGSAHIDLAASVEFIHTATLLHDDVVDKSDLRRGVFTANKLWGNKESVLVGDFLLGKAFELMGSASSLEVYRVLSHASGVISEGEVKQLEVTGKIDIEESEYFEVINSKTAELFAAACEIGGVIAGIPEKEVASLRSYGMNLGCAFQIIDDALDYSAKQETLGKNIGDDFREKKVTLPVIIAYKNATGAERKFWQESFDKNTADNPENFNKAILLMQQADAINETIKVARDIAHKANQSLQIFPDSEIRQILLDILEFVVGREF